MSAHPEHLLLDTQDIQDVTVVQVKVESLRREEDIGEIFDRLIHLVEQGGRHKLILNLRVSEFLSSYAIGRLVTLNKKLQGVNGRLALCHIAPLLEKVFENMHLTEVFSIYNDEEQALQSFFMLERQDVNDVTVLRVRSRTLKEQDLMFIFQELHSLVVEGGRRKLVLNFGQVESLSMPVIADLMRLTKNKVLGAGGQLNLCQLVQLPYEGFGKPFFHVYDTEEEAVRSFAGRK